MSQKCRLSVNINKPALWRNARGNNNPDIVQIAKDCERFGAEGITIHPRPDQRHIRIDDVYALKPIVTTEYNIEGKPSKHFVDMVCAVKPTQVTLVPDADNQLTSDHGWNTMEDKSYLKEIISEFKKHNIRVSIFVNADIKMIEHAPETGCDRIELYTGPYAHHYHTDKGKAIADYISCANLANNMEMGINAGHDLDLHNLAFFNQQIPNLLEVSIGHALFCDAVYFGLENTIQLYKRSLDKTF